MITKPISWNHDRDSQPSASPLASRDYSQWAVCNCQCHHPYTQTHPSPSIWCKLSDREYPGIHWTRFYSSSWRPLPYQRPLATRDQASRLFHHDWLDWSSQGQPSRFRFSTFPELVPSAPLAWAGKYHQSAWVPYHRPFDNPAQVLTWKAAAKHRPAFRLWVISCQWMSEIVGIFA